MTSEVWRKMRRAAWENGFDKESLEFYDRSNKGSRRDTKENLELWQRSYGVSRMSRHRIQVRHLRKARVGLMESASHIQRRGQERELTSTSLRSPSYWSSAAWASACSRIADLSSLRKSSFASCWGYGSPFKVSSSWNSPTFCKCVLYPSTYSYEGQRLTSKLEVNEAANLILRGWNSNFHSLSSERS